MSTLTTTTPTQVADYQTDEHLAPTFSQKSYVRFGADRFLTTPLMKWMWDQDTTDLEARKQPHASLLNASVEQLKDFPPTLIQVAESDILRDEGEEFGRHLAAAGVTVTTVRYNGVIHDWGMLNGLANEPATKSLVRHAAWPCLGWRCCWLR